MMQATIPQPPGTGVIVTKAVVTQAAAVLPLKYPSFDNGSAYVYCEEGSGTSLDLQLSFVCGATGVELGNPVDTSKFNSKTLNNQGKVLYEGSVKVPDRASDQVIVVKTKPQSKTIKEYLTKIDISVRGKTWSFLANSWVHKDQHCRFFFAAGLCHLPSTTPDSLMDWRQGDLQEIQGTKASRAIERQGGDRIYDYDVYTDLAPPKESRPILGGSAEFPYPRRLRTGRATLPGPDNQLYETRESKTKDFWTPLDERFDAVKQTNFTSYAVLSLLPAVGAAVTSLLGDRDLKVGTFREVYDMYAKLASPSVHLTDGRMLKALRQEQDNLDPHALKQMGLTKGGGRPLGFLPAFLAPMFGALSSSLGNIKRLVGGAGNLFDFPPPLAVKGREDAWTTDEEFGRQALAGVNPCGVQAVSVTGQMGTITEAHLRPHLQGLSLASLLGQASTSPRLLVIDHTSVFEEYAPRICDLPDRHGYSGRAVLFQRDDKQWVPIAIELKDGKDGATTVYTPMGPAGSPSPPAPTAGDLISGVQHVEAGTYLWLIVKGVFTTIDSAHHQLVTHWLRTHCVTEPYIIATHRNLSVLHPVYKLLVPHFRYTMQINSNARSSLINAGGIIESTLVPTKYSMELSSAFYAKHWRFDREGLPQNLIDRGLAKQGADGKLQLLLEDYPYADDGMLLWEALEGWIGQYLALYYTGTSADLTRDEELMAWWHEIVHVGHVDKTEGWPELKTVGDLVYILTTMIWTASCHHSAINFSQYAYSGFALNRPTLCYRRIPRQGDPEFEILEKGGKPGAHKKDAEKAEGVFLSVLLAKVVDAIKNTLTVELLSTHSDNEAYLNDPDHPFITDPQALQLYSSFVTGVNAIEQTIKQRNEDPARKTRVLPAAPRYEFLSASSPPGLTNKGVPQSISI